MSLNHGKPKPSHQRIAYVKVRVERWTRLRWLLIGVPWPTLKVEPEVVLIAPIIIVLKTPRRDVADRQLDLVIFLTLAVASYIVGTLFWFSRAIVTKNHCATVREERNENSRALLSWKFRYLLVGELFFK